ncbi:NAD(P)H-binding protein [Lentzea sp. BCCO 10_0798]|uniref:NAD(P)H-binding protein n=1 Tax=Lentzea kristufekii TaxID=3095430 RepID=A0ABU4TQV5_9PSEU|nr:NAD(P)H-binding protein [Lentzea sp. BCCO 10_0798]MDX8050665.1 NAD(P)H-binding protein [Lentzea sp. BCCO 10_0798]
MVVLGASGGTGRAVVDVALRAGHAVTAVVRRNDAIPPAPGLTVAVLPVLTDLAHVVAGHDAIISALGTNERGPSTVCSDGIRATLLAMKETNVRRLVAVSAHGAAESRDRSLYSLLLWASVKHKMRDKEAMEALIRQSDVDWTVVRPPALKDGPATGGYRAGNDLRIAVTSSISRADLADFLVCEAVRPAFVRQAPSVAA